jgi:DNA-binding Xre family transcriptional regulator
MALTFNLGKILAELDMTKNALAVEGKIRPATLSKYEKGEVDRIEVATLTGILDTANRLAVQKGEAPKYGIEDLITYRYEDAE